ncbi:inositol monophosphatase family protein [Cellulomonas aerilata]|uniref:Inositol-1-monophosphatase n=1 Tax=Cellulomonas aerilata TaxID=515326 RepID=A0A512DB56_9CELL|nr:inositol monophosphatase family protein [Cellulomonas aerilata]GEO33685.1 inositol monophosphatase [Cellulomonas aerilata]
MTSPTPDLSPDTTAGLPDAAATAALVDLAAFLARAAGQLVREGRPDRVDVAATKSSPVDVVTERDLAAEALLRSLIARHRPDDAILGEEEGHSGGTSGLTWVLDPIDGTVNYLYGIPAYAVSVAVVAGGRVPEEWTAVAGAVHSVPEGRTWTAGRGQGAFVDGRPLHVAAARPLAQSLVGTGFAYTNPRRAEQGRLVAELLPLIRDIRRIGSAALDLCSVATGTLDLYYERGLKPWDVAAGALVAAEAGAVVTGLHGAPAGEAMTVAGPTGSVEQLVAFLEEHGAASGA